MRQEKLGEGGRDGTLTGTVSETFGWSPAGGRTPPGNGWSPAGSRSCVDVGRPRLRSVDRECVGRVIQPRKNQSSRPTPSGWRKATSSPCMTWGWRLLRGSRAGHAHKDSPGTWEICSIPTALPGAWPPGEQRPDHLPVCGHARGRKRTSEPASGTVKRTQGSDVGRSSRSRSALTVAVKLGNRPEGPSGAREGAGVRRRARDR